MTKIFLGVFIPALVWCAVTPAGVAEVFSAPAKIVWVENGWFEEGLAFKVEPQSGVAGCPTSDDEFSLEASREDFYLISSMILTAFSTGANVIVTIHDTGDCAFGGRNKVESVKLVK
ncbi:hypothetical protein HY29_17885 [Hyphomonas beringensis]|uniref:Uncharacterized protein n=1 Tax=Hyphomonas beringensis TaxID=1280946 RepID=A0A062U3D5_9PROT|nr:hypothetical protein [Hyphomonas beringensis]KCZ52812.1 hypothetical protein HY29_17885 [Hyphomonas beringensis]